MSLKILLADDSMTAQNMGKKILSDAGYDVIAVSNGAQAVKKISEHKPDIAILDIYMPGYTGLEVCERVKSTLESSKTPVLLTVGKMEPYRPEDGSRVRADGVIVKPFEATDLLAVIEKLAGRIPAAKPKQPSYEDTIVIPPPTAADFSDENSKWKQTAADAGAERFDVPQEMQVAPALGLEEFGVEPVQSEVGSTLESALESSIDDAEIPDSSLQPTGFLVDTGAATAIDVSDEPMFAVQPDVLLETAPSAEITESSETLVQPFEVEFTSAPSLDDIAVEAIPELEPTIEPAAIEVAPVTEPALADPTELASEFATGFGTADAEDVPVGIIPELLSDNETPVSAEDVPAEAANAPLDDFEARVAAAMTAYNESAIVETSEPQPTSAVEPELESVEPEPETIPAWKAEEAPLEEHEATISLEEEMARMAHSVQAEPAPAPVEMVASSQHQAAEVSAPVVVAEDQPSVVEPVVQSFDASSVSDLEFAAAMAAAIRDKATEPAVTEELAAAASAAVGTVAPNGNSSHAPKLDETRIAHALQRVLERFKPQLVSEIARELASEDENHNE